jgi:succinate-semialdehyde dehydrogenase/glutarate-semialdehyde dehydrogenase
MPVYNPATRSLIAEVPNLGRNEMLEAIETAAHVQRAWGQLPAAFRSRILMRWHGLILKHADDLARILTSEQGKPLGEAHGEISAAAAYVEFYAEEAKRLSGDVIPGVSPGQRLFVIRQAAGVCAAITPWNFPSSMVTRKAAAALAVGCSVILKPAPQTPLSALALARLAEQAGIPPGAFSVITGDAEPIGEVICNDLRIAKISFTGSTAVGRRLMTASGTTVKRLSLELGGHAPFIVFSDADIERAVEGAVLSKFRNAGQTCVCANRFLIHRSVADQFLDLFVQKVANLKLGDGTDTGVTLGPLIDERAVAKVEAHIEDAVSKGAQIVHGGHRSALGGSFFEPTILTGITPLMRIFHEETFGPVAPISIFDTEEEVLGHANDSEFGLAAFIFSKDMATIWRVAEQLETGMVGVNSGVIATEVGPFGGIKQSGLGREGSRYGLEEYTVMKFISLNNAS